MYCKTQNVPGHWHDVHKATLDDSCQRLYADEPCTFQRKCWTDMEGRVTRERYLLSKSACITLRIGITLLLSLPFLNSSSLRPSKMIPQQGPLKSRDCGQCSSYLPRQRKLAYKMQSQNYALGVTCCDRENICSWKGMWTIPLLMQCI